MNDPTLASTHSDPERAEARADNTLGQKLRAAAQRNFVGRTSELALFEGMLRGEARLAVLLIHGPGGMGKTSLLGQMEGRATARGRHVIRLDARHIDPDPHRFVEAMNSRLVASDMGWPTGCVILIDTFERLRSIETWIREVFLPMLPADAIVVAAGRLAPEPGWGDLGWCNIALAHSLRELSNDEAAAYLTAKGVPGIYHARASGASHGLPLALSLMAEALQEGRADVLNPEHQDHLEVLHTLLSRFETRIPSEAHRLALLALVLAPQTTDLLLRRILKSQDTDEVLEWLKALPFVEDSIYGLIPHDLVREAFDALMRRRDPAGRGLVLAAIRTFVDEQLQRAGEADQFRFARDWLFMWRQWSPIDEILDWRRNDAYVDRRRPEDDAALLAIAEQEVGPETRRVVAHWLARQPEAFRVTRSSTGEPRGFFVSIDLHAVDDQDRSMDAVTDAAMNWMEATGDAPDQRTTWLNRLVVHESCGEGPSPSMNFVAYASITKWLCQRDLAWSFTASSAPETMQHLMAATGLFHRHDKEPACERSIDGHQIILFGRHWAIHPHALWKQPSGTNDEEPPPANTVSDDQLIDWVRDALRGLRRDDLLLASPLRSHLAMGSSGPMPVNELRTSLLGAVQALAARDRDRKFFDALTVTYVESSPSQESAAERLGVPFTTYRYQLRRGTEIVTGIVCRNARARAVEE